MYDAVVDSNVVLKLVIIKSRKQFIVVPLL